ncbi:MAG: Zn-ribbon domain-containing OB-fold protein [Actinomycetota bacterium]
MQVGTVVVLGVDPAPSGSAAPPPSGSAALEEGATPPVTTLGPTPLSDAMFRSAAGAVHDRLDAAWNWDAGEAVGAFLEGLREGRIVATFCASCERTLVPPRKFCERCFRPTDRWTEVAPFGAVETFSVCHVSWDMRPLDPPELPAVIRLDEASSGGFLHLLGDVEPGGASIGMAVEAVFLPAEQRTGSILDIAYFRPRREED